MKLELFQAGVKFLMSWHPEEKLLTRIFIIEFVMVPHFFFLFYSLVHGFAFLFFLPFLGCPRGGESVLLKFILQGRDLEVQEIPFG